MRHTRDDSPSIPEWLRDESGAGTQERVWADLLEILEKKGHRADIEGVAPKVQE